MSDITAQLTALEGMPHVPRLLMHVESMTNKLIVVNKLKVNFEIFFYDALSTVNLFSTSHAIRRVSVKIVTFYFM